MKRKVLLVLMAVIMTFALAACGGGSGDSPTNDSTDQVASYNWKFVLGESTGSPQEYYANLFKEKNS